MKKKMTFFVATMAAFGVSQTMCAKVEHLLPTPKSVTVDVSATPFALGRAVRLTADLEAARVADFFKAEGCTIGTQPDAPVVCVKRVPTIGTARLQSEAYRLHIEGDSIGIEVTDRLGVIRALQTLGQLAQGYEGTPVLEALSLMDYPSFAVRGFMHDVGRGFISVAELKKEIDMLSHFKINVFHWHLTDNQGWRIESKRYPQLTTKSFSRLDGKFYTQDEAREIEQYCTERGITLIPEVDMPGHSESFTRAMGFAMQTDTGVEALKAIITELCTEVFVQTPYFHVGTDETSISYPNFVPTMVELVRSLGKKAISWRPGASYTKDDIDMLTLWSSNGKVLSGVPCVDCRYLYANHFDTYADVVGIYRSNIYYTQEGTNDVAGAMVAFWNDRAVETEADVVRQNGLYAAALAMGERAWKGGGRQYIESGGTMLPPSSSEEFKEFADWERRFLFHKTHTLDAEDVPYVRQTNVRWRITDAFPNGGTLTKTFPPETDGLKTSYLYDKVEYKTTRATGAGIYLRHTWGTLVSAFVAAPVANSTVYAYTYVYSPKKQTVGAQIEFQNYGRSEGDLPPAQGKWDDRGSRVWLNDTELLPPVWKNVHTSRSSEITLKNENMSARSPISVTLNEGWNKVLLKLPVGQFSTNRVRLEKWGFTFVFVTADGTREVDGLIYSPEKYMDDATEALAELISQAKASRSGKVGTAIGYYSVEAAKALDAQIVALEPTLTDASVNAETRTAQAAALQQALADFEDNYATFSINLPLLSDASNNYWYSLCTPQRNNRYLTANGASRYPTKFESRVRPQQPCFGRVCGGGFYCTRPSIQS